MKCPSCGTEVWGNMESCPVCGHSLISGSRKGTNDGNKSSQTLEYIERKLPFEPEPGETVEAQYFPARYPAYLTALQSGTESVYILIPIFIAIYSGAQNIFSADWLYATVLPAIAVFALLFLVHFYIGKRIQHRARYIVTNRRIISIRGRNGRVFESMDISDVGRIRTSRGRRLVNLSFTNSMFLSKLRNSLQQKTGVDGSDLLNRVAIMSGSDDVALNNSGRSEDYPSEVFRPGHKRVKIRSVYSAYRSAKLAGNTSIVAFRFVSRSDADDARNLVESIAKQAAKSDENTTS